MSRSAPEALTPRELEVLAAIERRLTNVEIADELFISVRTVESHIASLRSKLGAETRSQLIAAAQMRRRTLIQLPQNSFVGRSGQLSDLKGLFVGARWVTVVGPAGCGKTRLALEFAAADARVPLVAEMEHASADDVATVVAHAVGLGADSSAQPLAACALALESQRYLLVLDNCDRVSGAVAGMVRELIARVRSLTVLVTSRSPLGGADETVFQLQPLPVADDRDAGAVRLFLDRASSAAPALRLSGIDVELAARICRRLDGLPLAIELAAARTRHVPVDELADRLDRELVLLDGPGPSERHDTLEAAFSWTWDLLDDGERRVLCQLAGLARTFDLDLAEFVTTPGAGSIVLRLLDRSFLAQTVHVSSPRRFRLLDSMRSFVLARADPAVVVAARHAHARYYAREADELARRIRTDDSPGIVADAKRIAPEVAAALGWALAEQTELALSLTRSLSVLVEHGGCDLDSLALIARAARTPSIRATATATELLEIGIALCYGDLELVGELASCALNSADDDLSQLAAHHLAGWADAYQHRAESALSHLDAAERLSIELGDQWQLASIRQAKGLALSSDEIGDPARAIALFESAAASFALAGDAMHVNNCRYMMCSTAASSGCRTPEAIAWVDQCEAYARATGNLHELAHARLTRAALAPSRDDEELLLETADTFQAIGDLRCLTRSYLLLAGIRSNGEQIPLLQRALAVATAARDQANQATVLERLVAAHWAAASQREAATTFGALVNLVGRETATGRCPPEMRSELAIWETAIAEGQARGHHVH